MSKRIVILLLGGAIFGGVLAFLVYAAFSNPDRLDEYMFYRTTEGLPRYEAKVEWLYDERPDLVSETLTPYPVYEMALEKPVWVHPPLASLLAYPFTKMTSNIQSLRLVPIALTVASLGLLLLLIRRRLGIFLAVVSISPILLFGKVLAEGGTFFYHEAFMLFFLVLTIYLSDLGSKWRYVSGGALALTKLPAIVLLIPLMIKDRTWMYGLIGVGVLVPYWVYSWVVGGSPWYLWTHWIEISEVARGHWINFVVPNLLAHVIDSRFLIYLIIVVPGTYLVFKAKQYWLVVLVGLTAFLGLGWAWIYYQMIEMVFVGLIAFSYLVAELGGRFSSGLLRKEVVVG